MSNESQHRERSSRGMRVMQWLMPRITPLHVRMYRALGGRLVGRFTGGAPVVLLTTLGRRTGRQRAVAVGYLRDNGDVIVAGTNGGLPQLPGWVLNLRAEPSAEVQVGSDRYPATAEFLEGEEWQRQWDRLTEAYPAYERTRRQAGRAIPLIRLRRTLP